MATRDLVRTTSLIHDYSRFAFAFLALLLVAVLAGCSDSSESHGSDTGASLSCLDGAGLITSEATSTDVVVDFSRPESVATLTGVLHGITAETPYHAIADIQLAAARGRGVFQDVFAMHGITPVLVVSDRVKLGGESPAANWSAYEDQVRDLAVEYGTTVIYDLWNEPDQFFFWPFWSEILADDNDDTAEFLEAFKRAHDTIRDVLGDEAVISGPSISGIEESLIQRFMDFSLREGLTVQVLSVHSLFDPDSTLVEVEQTLSRLYQEYIADPEYSEVGVVELHVNEYGAPKQYGRPGSMLALMRVMERAGVTQAMRAAWGRSEAFTDDINGLLVFTGAAEPLVEVEPNPGAMSDLLTPDLRPRPIWWAYKYYADGAGSRVAADSELDYIMPLASSTSESLNYNQLLLAAYDSENYPERPAKLGIQLKGLTNSSSGVSVKLIRIPYDDAATLDMPTTADECELRTEAGGSMTFSVEMPGDYEVLALRIAE